MKYNTIVAFFAFLFICHVAMAQSDVKSLTQNPNTGLYVHYDKNTYVSNETIWFTAYFLDSTKTTPEILSLFVVRHSDKQIVADKKFVVDDFISTGSITLPDSLQVGDYSIITYGNYLANDLPTYLHQQAISIKAPGRNVVSTMAISAGFEKGRSIKFKTHPEGGKLVANVEQLIAFEAIDSLSRPVQTRAVLMENGKVIDTISTNKEGFGRFKLNAQTQNLYTLKSLDTKQVGIDTLSKTYTNGVVLHLPKGIVQDTLSLELTSAQVTVVNIELSNALNVLEQLKNVEVGTKKSLQIPLANVPMGMQQIRVLDANNNILAERLFYAHYAKDKQKLTIQTDKRQYTKRDSVNLSLLLPDGLDTLAQVSIAVFHNNRMERSFFQDFEGQRYTSSDLRYWTALKSGLEEALSEDLLLIRALSSNNVISSSETKRIGTYKAIAVRNQKALRGAIPINLLGADGLEIITTDGEGNFSIPEEKMVMDDEKSVAVFVTGNLAPIVEIAVKDPYQEINQKIANLLSWPRKISVAVQSNISTTGNYIIDPNANKIEEVSIFAANFSDFYAIERLIVKNECGDYVCNGNFLNCPKSWIRRPTTVPEQGRSYLILRSGKETDHHDLKRYDGCTTKTNKSMQRFAGFNMSNAFYHYDKTELDRGAPLYASTLYWSPETVLQKNITHNIGFYVGDVPGRYTIIVQGVSNNGFVYAEAEFEVVEGGE